MLLAFRRLITHQLEASLGCIEFRASLGYSETMSQEKKKSKGDPPHWHFDKLRRILDLHPSPELYFNN